MTPTVKGTLVLAAAAGLLAAYPATARPTAKTHPSPALTQELLSALPRGQRLCYRQNAWISGADRRYAVVVTQASCGGSVFVHEWLHRTSASRPWRLVAQRSGTIDHPAGCTTLDAVPADLRCL